MKAITSLKLAFASLFLVVTSLPVSAQIKVAGELLIDLNVARGTNLLTGQNANIPAETSLVAWTNFGALGGRFDDASNSVYSAAILAGDGPAYSNAPFITNVLGTNAPATFGGHRMMVASFQTPFQLQGGSHYSVECWFYESSIPANPRGLFGWTLEAPSIGDAGELSGANAAAWHNDANTLNWNPAGTAPSLVAWHYGVLTYDGTKQVVYLDGSPANTNTVSLNLNSFDPTGLTDAYPTLFSGLIAMPATGTIGSGARAAMAALRVHSDALSAADVAANFAAGATTTPAAPNIVLEIDPVTGPESGAPTLNGNLIATGNAATTTSVFMYDTVDHGRTTNGWAHYVVAQAGNQFPGPFSSVIPLPANSTKFYVRAYATNSGDTNISTVMSFVSQGPPVINNTVASYNGPGSDVLYGDLVDPGAVGFPGTSVVIFFGPANGGSSPAAWASSNVIVPNSAVAGQVQYTATSLTTLGNYFYTYAAQNSFGTTWATPSVAFQEGALYTLNTTNLSAANSTISSWVSQAGTFVPGIGGGGGAVGNMTVQDFGGVKWASMSALSQANLYVPPASFPGAAPGNININGGSVVMIIKPELPQAAGPWENITAVYFSELGLALNAPSVVAINADSVASVTMNNMGSGYTNGAGANQSPPPVVTFQSPGSYPGGGIPAMDVTATGTAVLGTGANLGKVVSVTINNGGHGYPAIGPGFTGIGVYTIQPPTVTIALPTIGGGVRATGTAVLTATTGQELLPDVNAARPVDTSASPGDGGNTQNAVYVLQDRPSIITLVAGDGLDSGNPTDNNFRLYVNGILVEDSDFGFLTGVQLTTNGLANATSGSGYTNGLGQNQSPPPAVHFPAPTGSAVNGTLSTATGVAILGTGPNIGKVVGVTITSSGSGYTGNGIIPGTAGSGNPAVTFDAPLIGGGVAATGIATGIPLGQYNPGTDTTTIGAPAIGYNNAGMAVLKYNLPGFANNATFCLGQDALDIDPWSGFNGFIGDTYVFGEALTTGARQTLEAQLAAKFITAATLTFNIAYSHDANSTITAVPYFQNNNSVLGTSVVLQGEDQSYTIGATPGYAIFQNIDGAGAVNIPPGSYTFTNVSATHSIAITSVAIPLQEVTVTYGAGGVITTNGVTVPSGSSNSYLGGTSPLFAIAPNNGFGLGTVTVDGTVLANSTIQGIGSYTYTLIGANLGPTNHTINATFTALPASPVSASVPKSDYLLFALDTGLYPQTYPSTLNTLPVWYPTGQPDMIQDNSGATPNLATNFKDANGVIWESNVEQNNGTTTAYQLYPVNVDNGTVIPSSGATIILTCNPTLNGIGAGDPWHMVVDVFFGQLGLSVNPGTGLIQAFEDSFANVQGTSTMPIPKGTNAVLSEVIQPDGSFQVFYNTVQVISNAGNGPFTIQSGANGAGFADNIVVGDEWPDPWAAFDGLIGNVYVYQTALSDTDRHTLEGALLTQFHAVVPASFNWVGPNNGNWSTLANWSNTVLLATNTVPGLNGYHGVPVFSLTNTAGQHVNLDVPGITINGMTFNANDPNAVISGANTLTLDSGSTATPLITVNAGTSPSITASLTSLEGLNVVGGGTLALSGATTTLDSASGFLGIARDNGNTATLSLNGGTLTTVTTAQSWIAANGPGVMLGGADSSATTSILNLNGGTLVTPNIGNVTEPGAVLAPPSTVGGTAIVNLNGGVLQPSDSDSIDANAVSEGSAHLIFNTSHTYVKAGGAIINDTGGFLVSINTPLEHSGGSIQDGGVTVKGSGTLTLLQGSTYDGPTSVGLASDFPGDNVTLACAQTNSLGGGTLNITSPCVVELDFAGTSPVYRLNIDGAAQVAGTWGSSTSGAAHQDSHFAGNGTVTVVGTNGTTAPHITGTAIGVGGSSITVSGTGGKSGGVYTVLGSTNAAAPLSTWSTVAQGIFTAGPAFSVSIPVTNGVPAVFYDVIIP